MTKDIEAINRFLALKVIAVAGVSRDEKKLGYIAFRKIMKSRYKVYPINPNMSEIHEMRCYENVTQLPNDVEGLFIITKPARTEKLVQDAVNKGIKNIWIQQQSETKEAVEIAKAHQVNLIYKRCILMFLEPLGFPHNIHRGFLKLFGRL